MVGSGKGGSRKAVSDSTPHRDPPLDTLTVESQRNRFVSTARALGADEDEGRFKEKLATIARQRPKDEEASTVDRADESIFIALKKLGAPAEKPKSSDVEVTARSGFEREYGEPLTREDYLAALARLAHAGVVRELQGRPGRIQLIKS